MFAVVTLVRLVHPLNILLLNDVTVPLKVTVVSFAKFWNILAGKLAMSPLKVIFVRFVQLAKIFE